MLSLSLPVLPGRIRGISASHTVEFHAESCRVGLLAARWQQVRDKVAAWCDSHAAAACMSDSLLGELHAHEHRLNRGRCTVIVCKFTAGCKAHVGRYQLRQ